jgi:hypothetical protein
MSENFSDFPKSLWDLRFANANTSIPEIDGFIDAINSHAVEHAAGRKIAWIVPSNLAAAIINLYYESAAWESEWRTFLSEEEAVGWLGQNDS